MISARSASSMGITAFVNTAYIHFQKAEITLAALPVFTPQNDQSRSAGVFFASILGLYVSSETSLGGDSSKGLCSVTESLYSFSCSVIKSSGCSLAAAGPVRGLKLFS